MPNKGIAQKPNPMSVEMKDERIPFLKIFLPSVFLLPIFTLYFFPVLFEGKTFFFRDVKHFAFPMKLYLSRVWAMGDWPFWYPNLLQGTPLMPLMHPGIFYPPSALFLIPDFHFAFNAYFLIHHIRHLIWHSPHTFPNLSFT